MQKLLTGCFVLQAALAFSAFGTAPPQSAAQINAEAGQAIEQGHLTSAIAQLEPASHRFPNDLGIQFNLGLALVRAGRLEKAIGPLQKAAKDLAFSQQAHFLLGVDYFQTKQFAKAIENLRDRAGSSSPERRLYMLEESYRLSGQVQNAETSFHELITRFPDSAWTHYLMGNAYADQQEPEKAQTEYKQALERDPTMPNINFAIGYVYFRQGDPENARIWLAKEAARGCHGLANYYLGEIARADKDATKAGYFYRRSLTCDPTSSDAHLRLGMLFEIDKRYPEAVAQLRDAIRLKPDAAPAHYHLAAVYRAMDRPAASEAEFAKVKQIQANGNKQ